MEGKRRHVPDLETYFQLFDGWTDVVDTQDADDIPVGEPFSRGARLVRIGATGLMWSVVVESPTLTRHRAPEMPVIGGGSLGGIAYLSNRGTAIPWPRGEPGAGAWGLFLLAALGGTVLAWRWRRRVNEATGRPTRGAAWALGVFLAIGAVGFLVTGSPVGFDVPAISGRRYVGGFQLSPEFTAVLLGLVIYTAAFIAEIVRAGVLANGMRYFIQRNAKPEARVSLRLAVAAGETTVDGRVTLAEAPCLSVCPLAPVIEVDGRRSPHLGDCLPDERLGFGGHLEAEHVTSELFAIGRVRSVAGRLSGDELFELPRHAQLFLHVHREAG